MEVLLGILAGFGAAFFQSLSYVFSRLFLQRSGSGVYHLMVASHALMGAVSLIATVLLWRVSPPQGAGWLLPLVGTSVFYMIGQAAMFVALEDTESSRVSPMLGLKILVLSLISVTVFGKSFGLMRWAAVALSTLAAFMIHDAGGRLPFRTLAAVAVAVAGYSLSDLSIASLVHSLAALGTLAVPLAVAMSYVLCGALILPLLWRRRAGFTPTAWRYAAPHATAWLVAMVLLFACFGTIGVVLGNIVQSTRGLISVLFIPVLARIGAGSLDPPVSPEIFWKRAAAAFLMMTAVMLYVAAR